MVAKVSLYVHIPFCKRKCDYCHFFVLPYSEEEAEKLFLGIKKEWELVLPLLTGHPITSLYFGGGTPSLMGPRRIANLIALFSSHLLLNAEITLEANPEDVTEEKMAAFRSAGVTRVSLGVQSLNDSLLKRLSRRHSREEAIRAVERTDKAGIKNISIDLMYELPTQTVAEWKETVATASSLPISHLSLYNLTFEPGTVFFKKRSELTPLLPEEESAKEMIEYAYDFLSEKGLPPYEISAFAKRGFESHHNSGYWEGRPFLGLGPSAFSYWEGERFRNVPHLKRYLEALEKRELPIDYREKLEEKAAKRERYVIALRLLKGVPFDPSIDIAPLLKEGLLAQEEQTVRLTRKGMLFYDTVASELI